MRKKLVARPILIATHITKLKLILFLNLWRKKLVPIYKELYRLPKKLSSNSKKYGLGPGTRDPRSGIPKKTYYGSRDHKVTESRIRIRNTVRNRFLRAYDKFVGKKFYNSLKTDPHFFLQHFKNKIIYNFVKSVAAKKGMITNFFPLLSFVAVFGSWIRDPRSGIRDG